MNRHVCRVCAMKILFALDLNKAFDELEDLSRKIEYAMDPNFKLNESDSEIESFIVENNPFVQELVLGVKHNLVKIDEVISKNLKNWTIERLSYVDRAIIRLAVYELMETNTPASIIIDEAIEITKEYNQSEGIEKEYLREKTIKTWSSVILSLLFGFVVMSFVVLLASYGLAYSSYCSFFEKNIFASIFANHARIFASQPKGLFLGWIIGLGQLEYTYPIGDSAYAFANRVLTFFALIACVTLAVLYLLEKCKVIKNGDLLVALKDNQTTFVTVNLVFASTYLFNVFLWGANSYASFAICLPFLLSNLLLAHNLLKFVLPKEFTKALTIIVLTVVGVFFVFQFVTIFKINLPEKIQPIVNWLIQ